MRSVKPLIGPFSVSLHFFSCIKPSDICITDIREEKFQIVPKYTHSIMHFFAKISVSRLNLDLTILQY